ncbi:MAG: hypothetical protein SGARI_004939 [Bacillariaceae sp.]
MPGDVSECNNYIYEIGSCYDYQLEQMCSALGDRGYDATGLKFYDGDRGACYYPCQYGFPACEEEPECPPSSSTKASKGTKAPTDPLCKSTKAPKATKAPKTTKAPTMKSTKAPKGASTGSSGAFGTISRPGNVEPNAEDKTEPTANAAPPPATVVLSESSENAAQETTPAYFVPVVSMFGALLGVLVCVNAAMLWMYCRRNGGGSNTTGGNGDPVGTKVTVSAVKDGRVLVKKVIPLQDGSGGEIVSKTAYASREAAEAQGFYLPEMA